MVGGFAMNWFKQQRLEWIKEMVEIYGFIQRDHIQKKFRVSVPQASADLRDVQNIWPALMRYNSSAKRYEWRDD